MTTTTTTTFHLYAITDDSITKVHLGAKERPAGKTWCGVQLLVAGDIRFGGKYKDIVWTEVKTDDGKPNLAAVDCGACKRSAAWKVAGAVGTATYKLPAPKAPQDRKPKVSGAQIPSANERQELADREAAAGIPNPPKPKRLTAREKAAAKDAAKLAAEQVSGSSVVEADPETGLPRIKPEVQAKADAIVAEQVAKNLAATQDAVLAAEAITARTDEIVAEAAEADAADQAAYEAQQGAAQDAAIERITSGQTTVEGEVIDILTKKGSKK